MELDIRWKQRFENYKAALDLLRAVFFAPYTNQVRA